MGDAFTLCENLTTVAVSASVASIGPGVFLGCPNLTLMVEQGSFAAAWAQENDVPFIYVEAVE